MLRPKRYGILRVILTTLVIRTAMILFTLSISSFRNNHIPNYCYTSNTVNLNLDTFNSTSNNVNNTLDNNYQNNLNKNKHKLNSKLYLKGRYIHPITTIYNFVDNYNRINPDIDFSNNDNTNYNHSNYNKKIDNKLNNRLKWLTGFVSWDGERFLKNVIFRLTYTSEDSCAFFPLFPLLIYWLRKFVVLLLKKFFNFEVNDGLTGVYLILLIGVVLNNLLSLINNVLIYLIVTRLFQYNLFNNGYYKRLVCTNTTVVKPSRGNRGYKESQSDNNELYLRRIDMVGCLASIAYNLSPGFIFTTSFYTEPLYSLFYYLTLLIFMTLYTRNKDSSTSNNSKDKSKNDSLLVFTIIILAFITGFVRSNSILLAILLFFYKLYNCPLVNYIYNYLTTTTTLSNTNISKNKNKTTKDNLNKLLLLFKFICYWSLNLLYLFVILSPFFLIQLYGYFLYCNKLNFDQYLLFSKFHYFIYNIFRNPKLVYDILIKGKLTKNTNSNLTFIISNKGNKLKWCTNRIPSIYKHIQNRYWGIELFYTFKSWNNFVNLIYSVPTLIMLFMYVFTFTKHYILPNLTSNDTTTKSSRSTSKVDNRNKNNTTKDVVVFVVNILIKILTTVNNYEFGLFVHLLVTLNSFMLFSHIQIIFRQSLCLVQYLLQFSLMLFDLGITFKDLFSKSNKSKYNHNNNEYSSKFKKRLFTFLGCFFLYFYNSVLCFVGIILFSNFIGWT